MVDDVVINVIATATASLAACWC